MLLLFRTDDGEALINLWVCLILTIHVIFLTFSPRFRIHNLKVMFHNISHSDTSTRDAYRHRIAPGRGLFKEERNGFEVDQEPPCGFWRMPRWHTSPITPVCTMRSIASLAIWTLFIPTRHRHRLLNLVMMMGMKIGATRSLEDMLVVMYGCSCCQTTVERLIRYHLFTLILLAELSRFD
jgi:hypothetical protein